MVFDSFFDTARGVICISVVKSGCVKVGDNVFLASDQKKIYKVNEVGFFTPTRIKTDQLIAGHVGYVIMGIKSAHQINIGDTILHISNLNCPTIPRFDTPTPTVFASLYPKNVEDCANLRFAIQKLALNDSSVNISGCSWCKSC
ncbi:Translation factor Guf1, mitochondrial [Thelohanellus kitauei]|uniref:Translation factor Guf1, mitochondrial n=1 Tax=Thelohanellus kitauei TaxID=669202 RepID=A0A0C2NBY7_THEKT|nr:Translation factor Guf1, mitochondrial [Thelohanellus kitauei]